jgi:hypothetical protein
MVYTDDGFFCGPDPGEISQCMTELGAGFEIADGGDLDKYLGLKVTRMPHGTITLTQPHLIDDINADLGFKDSTKGKDTPAPSTASIDCDLNGKEHSVSWEYRSVIGKLISKKNRQGRTLRSQSTCMPDIQVIQKRVTWRQCGTLSDI